MISSALGGIPTDLMSLFHLPGNVEKKLNTIRSNFLWEENAEKRKIHVVKWQNVILIRRRHVGQELETTHKILLHKWLWKYNDGKVSIWKDLINAKALQRVSPYLSKLFKG